MPHSSSMRGSARDRGDARADPATERALRPFVAVWIAWAAAYLLFDLAAVADRVEHTPLHLVVLALPLQLVLAAAALVIGAFLRGRAARIVALVLASAATLLIAANLVVALGSVV